jgi:hypothetical protein
MNSGYNMNSKEDAVQSLLNRSYDVQLARRGDTFYLTMRDLPLVVCSDGLEDAYQKLDVEKHAYFQRMVEAGQNEHIPPPSTEGRRRRLVEDLGLFAAKGAIIGVLVGLMALASLPFVDAFAVRRARRLPANLVELVSQVSEKGFARLEGMPETERSELLLKLRKRVKALRPFYAEIEGMWQEQKVLPSD